MSHSVYECPYVKKRLTEALRETRKRVLQEHMDFLKVKKQTTKKAKRVIVEEEQEPTTNTSITKTTMTTTRNTIRRCIIPTPPTSPHLPIEDLQIEVIDLTKDPSVSFVDLTSTSTDEASQTYIDSPPPYRLFEPKTPPLPPPSPPKRPKTKRRRKRSPPPPPRSPPALMPIQKRFTPKTPPLPPPSTITEAFPTIKSVIIRPMAIKAVPNKNAYDQCINRRKIAQD